MAKLAKWLLAVFASSALVLASSVAGAATTADKAPLRIAWIDPLSGPMANLGELEVAEFKYIAEQINEAGGMDGHPVEIVPLDNKLSVQETLVQFQSAMDKGIRYILNGNGDPFAAAVINATNQHNQRDPKDRVVYLNYAAIGPQFVNSDCSFWQFLFDANTDMKMNILTKYVAKQKNIRKVFLIDQNYGFGHRVASDAMKDLKKVDPSVKIVGDVFTPLAKTKDFTPYVTQIKASGADAVITGNWGSDLTLLMKAAGESGLRIPFFTYYGDLPGTVTDIGRPGVGTLYVVNEMNGDGTNPMIRKWQDELKKQTGHDFSFMPPAYALLTLEHAVAKAHSIDPTKVAFALQGLRYDGPYGDVVMRSDNHQFEFPMFMTVLADHMPNGLAKTGDLNFRAIEKFTAQDSSLPTTCKMKRPARPQ
ncbi:MAG: branched-chain amino acid ABC transporter substrate-binding protein [Rhodanobacteraceae bacterium]